MDARGREPAGCLWARRPMASWAALGAMWQQGKGGGPLLSSTEVASLGALGSLVGLRYKRDLGVEWSESSEGLLR